MLSQLTPAQHIANHYKNNPPNEAEEDKADLDDMNQLVSRRLKGYVVENYKSVAGFLQEAPL